VLTDNVVDTEPDTGEAVREYAIVLPPEFSITICEVAVRRVVGEVQRQLDALRRVLAENECADECSRREIVTTRPTWSFPGSILPH
jgi:hypothetical protein